MDATQQDNPSQVQEPGRHAGQDAMAFVRKNIQAVSIAAGLVLLVAGLGVAYVIQQRRGEETASRMLGVADTPKQLEELLAQYPSSSAAPMAALALAARNFASGDYDQAVIQYGNFLRQYPKHPMAAAAELGKAMCFEGRGENEQALAGFEAFAHGHPGHFLLPQALMGKARCLQQANRMPEAKAVYEDFIVTHPDSEWKPQMEMALRLTERAQRQPKAAAPGPAAAPTLQEAPPGVSGQP